MSVAKPPKPPQVLTARSIGEVHESVEIISQYFKNNPNNSKNIRPILWYRAQEKYTWQLIPTLFRDTKYAGNGYTQLHLREDYRIQGFEARARHLVEDKPANRFAWQEVMQHHRHKTRLLDWTESLDISLAFALEAFLDPNNNSKDLEIRRKGLTPCIWVLNPYLLNSKVYRSFYKKPYGIELIKRAIQDLPPITRINATRTLKRKLESGKSRFFGNNNIAPEYDPRMAGLYNLSAIDDWRQANQNRIHFMLMQEEFNPLFYLLARYYLDGIPVKVEDLPPLAVVHPYHSSRIRQQKGAFTVFPHYMWRDDVEEFYKNSFNINSLAMDKQPGIEQAIYQIRIADPECMAIELLTSGKRISDIYPELDSYAKDLEYQVY